MTSVRGHLLYDEPPIAVSPTLARLLGPGKAIFLQQLHYFATRKAEDPGRYQDSFFDGRYWVYWSQRELLKQIPIGRSIDPHKLVVASLRKHGILLVERHRKAMRDHTNFYAIDYSALEAFVAEHHAAGGMSTCRAVALPPIDSGQSQPSAGAKATTLKTETTSERTSPTSEKNLQDAGVEVALVEEAEPFRSLLSAVVHGLPGLIQQQIADELSDRVGRTLRHQAPPIGDIRAWLISLRSRVEAGTFQPSGGIRIAHVRSAADTTRSAAHTDAARETTQQQSEARERLAVRKLLDAMTSERRLEVAELAAACAFRGRGPKARAVVLGDDVPQGPELLAIRKAIAKAAEATDDAP